MHSSRIRSCPNRNAADQGDGGWYASTLGPLHYGWGTSDYERNAIIDMYGRERVEELIGKSNLAVCLVVRIHESVLHIVPGGRNNAVSAVPSPSFAGCGSVVCLYSRACLSAGDGG